MLSPIEHAKQLLMDNPFTCVISNGETAYTSTQRGIAPLMGWYEDGQDLHGFSAADKVVGKAAAYLYVLLGVTEVYAQVISRPALEVLHRYEITVTYDEQVPAIRNRTNSGFCPMESAVMDIADAEEAYMVLKRKLDEINK